MRWLRAVLHSVFPQTPEDPLPRPETPVCVIGDVHGRLDLLDNLLAQIATRPDHESARVIVVGDMIDRGPDSAAVLARLHALHSARPAQVVCLMGNHERMLLNFLEDPIRHGPRWIAAGGAETLTSFGLSPFTRIQGDAAWQQFAAALRSALAPDILDWLGSLPLLWSEDLLAVTHAGADPALPIERQSAERLLWGPNRSEKSRRTDGIWVAQGHTVTATPFARAGRIAVDTGAWRSNTLSAAWLDKTGLCFLSSRT